MSYFINNLNQKIAYKFFKGKSPGIIFIHGLNSDMEGTKAISIEKFAKKGNSRGSMYNFQISLRKFEKKMNLPFKS